MRRDEAPEHDPATDHVVVLAVRGGPVIRLPQIHADDAARYVELLAAKLAADDAGWIKLVYADRPVLVRLADLAAAWTEPGDPVTPDDDAAFRRGHDPDDPPPP